MALVGPDKENLWHFDMAVIGEKSEMHHYTLPSDFERKEVQGNLWIIRNKGISADIKKGAKSRS